MAVIRPKDEPSVALLTSGDRLIVDGATVRSIAVENFLSGTVQHVSAAGAIVMATTDGLIAVDKTVGASSAVSVPLSSTKIGPCLVADFKGDAGTNNITLTLTGPDVFPGGGSTWVIAADTGSVFLRPIPGVGYAI